ncbi:MAG: hypothetical protein IJD51_03610 [Clostridia bacterium]|nr:hypothetical protein [Clostridia bacterium]
MTKHITIYRSTSTLLRRISTILYLLVMLGCLAFIGFGFIPLYGQKVNAIVAAVNLFEIVNIFSKSFWPVLCTVAFSAAYYALAVAIAVEIIKSIPLLKRTLTEKNDTDTARDNASLVAYNADRCVVAFLCLIILSAFISPYSLSTSDVLILAAFFTVYFGLSAMQLIYRKCELVTAIAAPVGRLLYVIITLTFTFAVSEFNVYDFFNSIGNLFSLFGYEGITFRFILNLLLTDIIAPALHAVMLVMLLSVYEASYGITKYSTVKSVAKKVMILMLIFVAAMLLIGIFTNERNDANSIKELALCYLDYVILSVAVFFVSFLCYIDVDDAPFATDPVRLPPPEITKPEAETETETKTETDEVAEVVEAIKVEEPTEDKEETYVDELLESEGLTQAEERGALEAPTEAEEIPECVEEEDECPFLTPPTPPTPISAPEPTPVSYTSSGTATMSPPTATPLPSAVILPEEKRNSPFS